MIQSHTVEKAGEYAAAAMAAMAKRGIPPIPDNFATWYSYVSGAVPDLVKALDVVIGNDREFTTTVNEQIHDQFFGGGREAAAAREASTKVEAALSHVIKHLSASSDEHQRYGGQLADLGGKLGASSNQDELRAMIVDAVRQTQQMAQHNKALEQQLSSSTTTIRGLRENLEDVRREAMTDGLTGVANRKFFDASLREAATHAMETGEPVSLLMLDVDHFKRFNDSYGHQTGDQVLKLVAKTLTGCIKGRDLVARYGGEEFAVILPATTVKNAAVVAEQIRHAIANKKVVKRSTGEDMGSITMSIGCAAYELGEALSDLVAHADAALYMAKRTGRNKVMTHDQAGADLAVGAA